MKHRNIEPEQLTNTPEANEDWLEKLPYETEMKFNIAMNPKQPFGKRLKAFWKGENDLGRGASRLLDVFFILSPKVKTGRDLVREILKKDD